MKKSLVKKLVRLAKDGDPEAIEAVAELLEEVAEIEAVEGTGSEETLAEPVAETVPAAEPTAVVETPEATIVIDEATLGEILSRLDQIISLLAPLAADEDPECDPVEEIVEAVGEAVQEAVAAAAEDPEVTEDDEDGDLPAAATPEAVAAMVEEIVEPALSEVLEPDPAEDECGEEEELSAVTGDALRAALNTFRPALMKMPEKQRRKISADIAGRMCRQSGRRAMDGRTYAAMASASRRRAPYGADLGRRIMARRNPNYKH